LFPVFGPSFAPGHFLATNGAGLAGQALLVAFERGFHRDIVAVSWGCLQAC
jgi:hypothetical protein